MAGPGVYPGPLPPPALPSRSEEDFGSRPSRKAVATYRKEKTNGASAHRIVAESNMLMKIDFLDFGSNVQYDFIGKKRSGSHRGIISIIYGLPRGGRSVPLLSHISNLLVASDRLRRLIKM